MTSTLPTPREVLTSLISTLASAPVPGPSNDSAENDDPKGATGISHKTSTNDNINPLKLVPRPYRSLLTTLHVIYPSTLLPALDLLDRHLATRIFVGDKAGKRRGSAASPPPPPLSFYLVRSAVSGGNRKFNTTTITTTTAGKCYIVRPEAWNCTCAAFAFSAFPPPPAPTQSASSSAAARWDIANNTTGVGERKTQTTRSAHQHGGGQQDGGGGDETMHGMSQQDSGWEFGGLSTDGSVSGGDGTAGTAGGGSSGGGVPCCKHLLACVLADKWGALLGGYVEERIVSREEGAGLVADV